MHALRLPAASTAATMPTPARRSGLRPVAEREEVCAGWSGDSSAGTLGSPSVRSCEVECWFMLWESSRSVDIRPSTAIGLSDLVGMKVRSGFQT
ncbi:hypothetical protein GCM10009827_067780 [Dactylosporangium maewongense]|uniref:Uncharacterized protein n=1 Tax=Dactylosporangium maewongense TaxID=634393 RepID=A0ABP4M7C0_9ACTN